MTRYTLALSLAAMSASFGATISLNTGVAAWQVFVPGTGLTSAVVVTPNGAWAQAPTGSSWVSYGAIQSTICSGALVAGVNCASVLTNPAGDLWTYQLTISAASLGATSGNFSFVFGADNAVKVYVGSSNLGQFWGNLATPGNGATNLGCVSAAGGNTTTNVGNTNPYTCNNTVAFNASTLNKDGSLTLYAYVSNDPALTGGNAGNPSGLVLSGTLNTGTQATPEPATFGLVGMAGLVGLIARRFRSKS